MKASPNQGVARSNVTKARQSQCGSPIPMGRKDHGGGDAVGRPQTLDNQGTVIKKRERWLQGHRNSASIEQPASRSAPAVQKRPWDRYDPGEGSRPGAATHRAREEGRYALTVSD